MEWEEALLTAWGGEIPPHAAAYYRRASRSSPASRGRGDDPDLSAENCETGNDHDRYGDDNEGETISNSLFRQKKHCSKPASSMFAHPTRASIEVRLSPSTTRAKGLTAAASSWSSVRTSSTISSTRCAKTKSKAGRAPADRSSTCCCVAMRWMSSTERWKDTKPSASHTCLISRQTRGGEHGDE
jgi:hypothetical protein